MIGEIKDNEKGSCDDPQKLCKWGLIIGVPSILLIIVIIIVVVVFTSGQ